MSQPGRDEQRPDSPTGWAGLIGLGVLVFLLVLLWRWASYAWGWHNDSVPMTLLYAAFFSVWMVGIQYATERWKARRRP